MLAVTLGLTTGCGILRIDLSYNPDPGRGIVGISLPATSSSRWAMDGAGLAREFRAMGYLPKLEYAHNDLSIQVAQLKNMIAHNVRLLVICAVDSGGLSGILAKAARKHIPVVAYNRPIQYSRHVDYVVTFDNHQAGKLQAQYIISRLDPGRNPASLTIELFAGPADDPNAQLLFAGAMSVLRPYIATGQLVVTTGASQVDQVATPLSDATAARRRMAAILGTNYRGIRLDAVLAPSDDIAKGVIDALRFTGYGKPDQPMPVVTGYEATIPSVKRIIAGQQAQTVFSDPRALARAAATMGDNILRGRDPAVSDRRSFDNGVKTVPAFLVSPVSVDQANYADVLVNSGYYTAGQLAS